MHYIDTYKLKTKEKAITRETVFVEGVTGTVAVVSVVVTVVGSVIVGKRLGAGVAA